MRGYTSARCFRGRHRQLLDSVKHRISRVAAQEIPTSSEKYLQRREMRPTSYLRIRKISEVISPTLVCCHPRISSNKSPKRKTPVHPRQKFARRTYSICFRVGCFVFVPIRQLPHDSLSFDWLFGWLAYRYNLRYYRRLVHDDGRIYVVRNEMIRLFLTVI